MDCILYFFFQQGVTMNELMQMAFTRIHLIKIEEISLAYIYIHVIQKYGV